MPTVEVPIELFAFGWWAMGVLTAISAWAILQWYEQRKRYRLRNPPELEHSVSPDASGVVA